MRDRIGRRGGRRTVHGDGIARGDGRAGARLDDFHGGGDTCDGLHGREDGGYDEKEERGERPAHPIVMRTRCCCVTAFWRRASETVCTKTGSSSSPATSSPACTRSRRVDSRITYLLQTRASTLASPQGTVYSPRRRVCGLVRATTIEPNRIRFGAIVNNFTARAVLRRIPARIAPPA